MLLPGVGRGSFGIVFTDNGRSGVWGGSEKGGGERDRREGEGGDPLNASDNS